MVTAKNSRPSGSLDALLTQLLDRGYDRTAGSVVRSIARSSSEGIIEQRLRELDEEIARLTSRGLKLTDDNAVLRALLADLEAVTARNAARLDGIADEIQMQGISAARVATRQLALPGVTDAQLREIGIQWQSPDPEAINRLVGYVQAPEFRQLLQDYQDDVLETVRQVAIRGIVSNMHPTRTARLLRQVLTNYPAYRANTLARTLQLSSYRAGAAVYQNANVDIISEVIRIAALDDRTCLACIAQSGMVIWSGELNAGDPIPQIVDHHNGRCTTVVRVKGRNFNVRNGQDWFNNLSRDRQMVIAGSANLHALEDGAVTLNDFVERYTDPVFGEMIRQASLKGILGEGARQYYRR